MNYVCDEDEDGGGECYWMFRSEEPLVFRPEIVKLARALCGAGVTTPEGLAVVAEV